MTIRKITSIVTIAAISPAQKPASKMLSMTVHPPVKKITNTINIGYKFFISLFVVALILMLYKIIDYHFENKGCKKNIEKDPEN